MSSLTLEAYDSRPAFSSDSLLLPLLLLLTEINRKSIYLQTCDVCIEDFFKFSFLFFNFFGNVTECVRLLTIVLQIFSMQIL